MAAEHPVTIYESEAYIVHGASELSSRPCITSSISSTRFELNEYVCRTVSSCVHRERSLEVYVIIAGMGVQGTTLHLGTESPVIIVFCQSALVLWVSQDSAPVHVKSLTFTTHHCSALVRPPLCLNPRSHSSGCRDFA